MAICEDELNTLSNIKIDNGQAQAYYACQYFAAMEKTNFIRNALAVAKIGLDVIIANRNYELAKGNLERLNKITDQQVAQSAELHGQWAYGKQCERDTLDAACSGVNIPEPNYQAIYSRVASVIAAQYGNARRKIKQRFSVYCQAAACAELRKIDLAEASAISAGVEAAYRKEEANYQVRLAAAKVHLLNVLQHMRGLLANTSGLLAGAAASARAAAEINPYYGFSQAANQAFGALQGMTYQGALSAQSAGAINGMNALRSNQINTNSSIGVDTFASYRNAGSPITQNNIDMDSSGVYMGGGSVGINDQSRDPYSSDYQNEFDRQEQTPNFINGLY